MVLCSDTVQYATYAYWALKMAGHQKLRILDGGLERWRRDGRPMDNATGAHRRIDYPAGVPDSAPRVGRDWIRERLGTPELLLLDARSPEEFSGQRVMPPPGFDHGAQRCGRIPGAVSLYFRKLLNEDDTFRNAADLEDTLGTCRISRGRDVRTVVYCRLSHRATLVWFAMTEALGLENVAVYDGSWTEWGSIVGFPIEV